MTYQELSQYRYISNMIERIEIEYLPSYISAVDTSKPAVQTSNISDMTSDIAIANMKLPKRIESEYKRLRAKKKALDDYIMSIDDELIRSIAIRHFIFGDTYEKIGKECHYSRTQVSRLLNDYLN